MNKKTKVRVLYHLLFFVVFLIVWLLLHVTFKNLDDFHKGLITSFFTVLLSPRIKEYETQSGTQVQVKWLFLKKVIST